MRKRTLARECCLKILYQIEILKGDWRKISVAFWNDNSFDDEVRGFADTIVEGVMEHLEDIDKIILKHTQNWDLGRMAVLDRNILRMATCELLYMDDIPHKVSINEAVNMAKKYSLEDSGKFVNGVLDHISHTEKR